MSAGSLVLLEVYPKPEGENWRVFTQSLEFPAPWWEPELRVDVDEHWISVRRDGAEVARCKFILDEQPLTHRTLGSMPHGRLDILAFEVALSARRTGIERATLLAIRAAHPYPRLTALNDDATSRRFWDGIGWLRHQPANPVSPGTERVTYSEV